VNTGALPVADIAAFPKVPAGQVAVVVTSLEMLARPDASMPASDAFDIRRVSQPEPAWYRDLFRRVGGDWLWFSRLKLDDDGLSAIIRAPGVEIFALAGDGRDEGLLELDFRTRGQCEIRFFGVTGQLIGRGAGRALMAFALRTAWARPIQRVWVHTCTADHPGALQFYVRAGFTPYLRQIEVADDPRLTGLLPETAAPHIPIIRP
jgi:GNAT superfamily N-acetyltransferase